MHRQKHLKAYIISIVFLYKQNNKSTPLQSASKPLGDKAEVDKTPPDRETVSARSEKVDLGNGKSFPNKKSIIQEPASNSVLNDDSELFKPAAAVSGLFVSAEDELFSTKINKPEKSKPTPEKDKSLFLYDNDDDDEEEDLFSSLSNKAVSDVVLKYFIVWYLC